MTDWYQTKTAKKVGFTARPVVGGVFLQMLYDQAAWKKWASRDKTKAANWAPLPKPPKTRHRRAHFARTSRVDVALHHAEAGGRLVQSRASTFGVERGPGGFGTRGTPGAVVRHRLEHARHLAAPRVRVARGQVEAISHFWMHHDEDAEVYINGVLAATATGYTSGYEELPLNATGQGCTQAGQKRNRRPLPPDARRPIHRRGLGGRGASAEVIVSRIPASLHSVFLNQHTRTVISLVAWSSTSDGLWLISCCVAGGHRRRGGG